MSATNTFPDFAARAAARWRGCRLDSVLAATCGLSGQINVEPDPYSGPPPPVGRSGRFPIPSSGAPTGGRHDALRVPYRVFICRMRNPWFSPKQVARSLTGQWTGRAGHRRRLAHEDSRPWACRSSDAASVPTNSRRHEARCGRGTAQAFAGEFVKLPRRDLQSQAGGPCYIVAAVIPRRRRGVPAVSRDGASFRRSAPRSTPCRGWGYSTSPARGGRRRSRSGRSEMIPVSRSSARLGPFAPPGRHRRSASAAGSRHRASRRNRSGRARGSLAASRGAG